MRQQDGPDATTRLRALSSSVRKSTTTTEQADARVTRFYNGWTQPRVRGLPVAAPLRCYDASSFLALAGDLRRAAQEARSVQP